MIFLPIKFSLLHFNPRWQASWVFRVLIISLRVSAAPLGPESDANVSSTIHATSFKSSITPSPAR